MALTDAPRSLDQRVRTLLITGVILGIGLVGTLDEIVLHQLLQWHNLYVHTTEYWRIFIDGLFHAFSSAMLFAGAMRLWSGRRSISSVSSARPLVAGILYGMGGFNLYDGIVQHKLMQLHPVREGIENQLPYDLTFNGIALLLLIAGWLVWRSVHQPSVTTATRDPDVAVGRRQ
jgi:uncharacterized membrane protein